MKDIVINEVKNEFNWKERILLNMFTKVFIKAYNIGRINTINKLIY